MPSLDYMQKSCDNKTISIMKHCELLAVIKDKSEELFKTTQELEQLTDKIKQEIESIFVVVAQLANCLDVSLQDSYQEFIRDKKDKGITKFDKFIDKLVSKPFSLPDTGRSSFDYHERNYLPNKVLFHRLTNSIRQTENTLQRTGCCVRKTINDLPKIFGEIIDNLIDFSHKYEFSLEDAVTSNTQDNRTEEIST